MNQDNDLNCSIVEALILASPEPLPAKKVSDLLEDMTPGKVGRAVAELNSRYYERGSSYRIREIAGGYQFYILPEFTGFVEEMFTRRRKMRLTRAALETLAIVAYRQPVTKTDIEHIRGVASDGVLHNLLEKGMIAIKGRAETVGRPLQYGTTDEFLKFFGLNSLEDLPKMKEIEELIREAEPDNEGQLSFESNVIDVSTAQKLNVADGTFDPRTREEDDDLDEDVDAAKYHPAPLILSRPVSDSATGGDDDDDLDADAGDEFDEPEEPDMSPHSPDGSGDEAEDDEPYEREPVYQSGPSGECDSGRE
jgi:segregation and condensation protein B